MAVLDKLKAIFVPVQDRQKVKRLSADQTGIRRRKFIAYLGEQKKLTHTPQSGLAVNSKKRGKRQRSHFWNSEDGSYIFAPRYGTSLVVVFDETPHIKTKNIEHLNEALDGLIEATEAGELDAALAKAAEKKRKNPAETNTPKIKGKQ